MEAAVGQIQRTGMAKLRPWKLEETFSHTELVQGGAMVLVGLPTYVRTYIHTYTHTHIYIYIYNKQQGSDAGMANTRLQG